MGIKFGGWVPNCHCKHIGGFKFGGSVYVYMYMRVRNLADFNLAVVQAVRQTAKFLAIHYNSQTSSLYVHLQIQGRAVDGTTSSRGSILIRDSIVMAAAIEYKINSVQKYSLGNSLPMLVT